MEMKDMTGKTISRNQAPNILQEQQKLEDDARQEEETENVKEDAPDIFDDPAEAVGTGALEAETGAIEAEEAGTSALSGLLADAGDLGATLAGIGSEALGPLGAVVGLGLGVYELGNAFHWWGGGHSETPDPPPEKPDVTPPTAPDLQDIPKPKNIIVKNVAPSKSISAHYNLVSAPTMNSNLMRR